MFRLKAGPVDPDPDLPTRFEVTLHPHSVFLMPLSTNRCYIHEVRPSGLDAGLIPDRLGYVVRCSSTRAVHRDGATHLDGRAGLRRLEPPTPEGVAELKVRYAEENATTALVDYGDRFGFSLNTGDYLAPILRPADEFRTHRPAAGDEDRFEALSAPVRLEPVGRGRWGAALVWPDERGVPIVRTTTRYDAPAQPFPAAHRDLAERIRAVAQLPVGFNNALIERYGNAYATMGAHSDQALDLEAGSVIAVYSCYRLPVGERPPRLLVVEPKDSDGDGFTVPLAHGAAVVFSLDTNRRYRHRIVLDAAAGPEENDWLGITFRTSGTFVRHDDGSARLADGTPLLLADEDQAADFHRLRRRENRETDFTWPSILHTVSSSDLLPPAGPASPG